MFFRVPIWEKKTGAKLARQKYETIVGDWDAPPLESLGGDGTHRALMVGYISDESHTVWRKQVKLNIMVRTYWETHD